MDIAVSSARRAAFVALAALAITAGSAASALAATPLQGRYRLANHPDGSVNPPPYGLRMDELFNATSGHDVFTFDFNHSMSSVVLDYFGSTIRIHGQAFGGRDIGSVYANDVYRGVYGIDFTYDLGVGQVPGDDDIWVDAANHANDGQLSAPNGLGLINLVDERGSFDHSFRFGDENNDAGHRGHPGISGWGWLSIREGSTIRHTDFMDWLFIATYESNIPAPSTAALLGLGGLMAARRRR